MVARHYGGSATCGVVEFESGKRLLFCASRKFDIRLMLVLPHANHIAIIIAMAN